jgi:hypothetical protein
MMQTICTVVFEICGPLSILSLFAIGSYLYRKRVYTLWQLRTSFMWPQLIVRYRDHTRETQGYTGIWYYVAIMSILLSVISVLYLFSASVIVPLIEKIRMPTTP